MTTDAVFPEGHVHWTFRLLQCFGKKVRLEGVQDKFYTVICNRFVYTTDGKFFYGYYTPEAAEDLDPFSMMPPDFLFCCQCCCYLCCKCYRKKYDSEYAREADLFFSRDKEDKPKEEPIDFYPKEGLPKEPTKHHIKWEYIDDSIEPLRKI